MAISERTRHYRAPGRVNLIGEHTDYNDGFVMPIALDRSTWVAATPRADRLIVARSESYPDVVTIDLDRPPAPRTGHWSDYVAGVAVVLDRATRLLGADLQIRSDVPIGAGLSSSAALEVACGYALLDLSGGVMDLTGLARACQRAEDEFGGTRCGLMDQFIACHGRAAHALMLDTRTLGTRWLPMPAGAHVMICDTMKRHRLASSEYNARQEDCRAGVRALSRRYPDVRALRDVTRDRLESARGDLSERLYRRCRHVVTENARVEAAADALAARDLSRFGQLMAASHHSLRDDYEVSCAELDAMVAIAMQNDGVYGARMTGGGFGGCVVCLIDERGVANVPGTVARRYEATTGVRPDVWISSAGPGVGRLQ